MLRQFLPDTESVHAADGTYRRRPTGAHLVEKFKKTIEGTLRYGDCDVFVLCFDKAMFVSVAKGAEQAKRDASGHVPSVLAQMDDRDVQATSVSYEEKRPYIELDKPLPADWHLAMRDREATVRHILSWLSEQLLSPHSAHRIEVPECKTFLIDGHCLCETQLLRMSVETGSRSSATLYQIPVSLGVPFEKQLTERGNGSSDLFSLYELQLAPLATNSRGEADFAIFWYLRLAQGRSRLPVDFRISSTDTDILLYGLVYLERYGPGHVAGLAMIYGKKWTSNGGLPKEQVADLLRLRELINAEPWARKVRLNLKGAPVVQLALSMVFAGCDYMEGLQMITHAHLLDAMAALLSNAKSLAALPIAKKVTPNGVPCYHLQTAGIRQLLVCAYACKWRKHFARDSDALDEDRFLATLGEDEVREKLRSKLSEKNAMPPDSLLRCLVEHGAYMTKFFSSIGFQYEWDADPLYYGYAKRNDQETFSRRNVRRRYV